jgi:hypothetical protein
MDEVYNFQDSKDCQINAGDHHAGSENCPHQCQHGQGQQQL